MGNRKRAETFILEFMKDLEPTGYNVEQWKKILADMSDKDFHEYMIGLRDKTKFLVVFKPMYKAEGMTLENTLKIGEKYGVKFFEKLVFTGNPSEPDHKTNIEFLVGDSVYRRQSQTSVKKISVPDNNKTIDQLTYQPTGASKGSKLSLPELQVLVGMGMDKTIEELFQIRGGDKGGFNAYNAMIMRYGSVNMKSISQFDTGVESSKAVKVYFACMNRTISL